MVLIGLLQRGEGYLGWLNWIGFRVLSRLQVCAWLITESPHRSLPPPANCSVAVPFNIEHAKYHATLVPVLLDLSHHLYTAGAAMIGRRDPAHWARHGTTCATSPRAGAAGEGEKKPQIRIYKTPKHSYCLRLPGRHAVLPQ